MCVAPRMSVLDLKFFLPKPKPSVLDPLAPLGVRFGALLLKEDDLLDNINLDDDIEWMKSTLPKHALIGPISEDLLSVPVREPRGSIGGGRASELATQFEEDEIQTVEYPASTAIDTYLDQLSGDEDDPMA